MDKSDWWIPFKNVGRYKLGVNINDIPKFFNEHVVSKDQDIDLELESNVYNSVQNDCILHTFSCHLNCVTYWDYFYVLKDNVIGKNFDDFIDELHRRFGKIVIREDTPAVLYDDGSVQVTYEVKHLGLEFDMHEDTGTIYSVSVSAE